MHKTNRIITTSDGSHTLYVPELDEHYHSVHGAIQESEHVFMANGFDFCSEDPVKIFEIGFGTGLNGLLTAVRGIRDSRQIFYTAIEKYPLQDKIVKVLNYPEFTGRNGKMIFEKIHSCEWGKVSKISKNFNLIKICCDLVNESIDGCFNLIFFDAFGPEKQPEMWTAEIFKKISAVTATKGILVTYSAKGEVKRNLESGGFNVSRIPGPPGKREMIRAIKS
jgi:tRNA U34 5-methylaminomethyl-2-thiouridine-forming methyltransferase MnmC